VCDREEVDATTIVSELSLMARKARADGRELWVWWML
jgi:hypothetical protein